MGTVTQLPTLKSLQDQVNGLTGLVAGFLAVLNDREALNDPDRPEQYDGVLEVLLAGDDALRRGPLLGQDVDPGDHGHAIFQYACHYIGHYKAARVECDTAYAQDSGPDGEDATARGA